MTPSPPVCMSTPSFIIQHLYYHITHRRNAHLETLITSIDLHMLNNKSNSPFQISVFLFSNIHRFQIMRGVTKATVTWAKLLTCLQSPFPPKKLSWPPSFKWWKPLQNEKVSILKTCKVAEWNRKTGRVSLSLVVDFYLCLTWKHLSHVILGCVRLTVQPSHKNLQESLLFIKHNFFFIIMFYSLCTDLVKVTVKLREN